ncbi:DUF1801 domain-containing protein [Brevibacillus fortis]|uniref:DUF1801 domain-containing protein n=1 Tax=Brevibacillus fortis TaxID=2126352 RepID=UPI002E211C2A|nr:DUF1801 domain-containing protein [Brevibacillus fortis]
MNQQVTDYIQNITNESQVEVCNRIRQLIHENMPNVEEQVKYKQAFYSILGKQVCVYFPAKDWINVTLFQAANLEAPAGFFEKSDHADRKTIKIRNGKEFDFDVLAGLFKKLGEAQ